MGFSLTDPKHPNLEKLVVDNLCGGPSQIFTRHHESGKTTIRPSSHVDSHDNSNEDSQDEGKMCQSVLGYDASSLYPYCLTKPLPVGPPAHYELHKPEDGFYLGYHFEATMSCSRISQLQMNYCCSLDSSYRHLWNTGKEVRIGNFRVDAYSASKNEVIEVSECFWHRHECHPFQQRSPERIQRYERTLARVQFIEEVTGLKVKLVWECQIPHHIKDRHPPVYLSLKKKPGKQIMAQLDLLALVRTGEFFGAVEVDIEVPPDLKEKFSEFAPLFVTCEIPMTKEVIGERMYTYVEEQHLSLKPRKQLVAGLKARQILLATPLLRWYLSKGLKVTKVYQAIEWNSQPCLKDFFESVAQDRRQASGDPTKEAHAIKTETDCQFSLRGHTFKQTELHSYSLPGRKRNATPLLRWYLSKGLKVTKVYQAIEWNSQPCLKDFFESVAQDRRQASGDPTKEAHAIKTETDCQFSLRGHTFKQTELHSYSLPGRKRNLVEAQ